MAAEKTTSTTTTSELCSSFAILASHLTLTQTFKFARKMRVNSNAFRSHHTHIASERKTQKSSLKSTVKAESRRQARFYKRPSLTQAKTWRPKANVSSCSLFVPGINCKSCKIKASNTFSHFTSLLIFRSFLLSFSAQV